jgi:hypothetical protein
LPAILAVGFVALAPTAQADDVEVTREIIDKQIQAFLKDDAETAYSFAAPGVRARFPDKDKFFEMVKKNYQPVYHPGNYAFGRSKTIGDGEMILHEVIITGTDGKEWKALYKMVRQPDGTYRIGGVAIIPETSSKGI